MYDDIKTETHQVIPATGYVKSTTFNNDDTRLVEYLPIVALRCAVQSPGLGYLPGVDSDPVVLSGGEVLPLSEIRRWFRDARDEDGNRLTGTLEIVRLATMGDRIGCPRSPGLIDAEGNPVREDGATR